jgi:hypothetical protein
VAQLTSRADLGLRPHRCLAGCDGEAVRVRRLGIGSAAQSTSHTVFAVPSTSRSSQRRGSAGGTAHRCVRRRPCRSRAPTALSERR